MSADETRIFVLRLLSLRGAYCYRTGREKTQRNMPECGVILLYYVNSSNDRCQLDRNTIE